MSEPYIMAAQAIVVGLIMFGGQVLVARLSKKAQTEQTEVDSQAKATEAWQQYAEKMEQRLNTLEARFAEVEAQHEEDRRRLRALERRRENDRDLIRTLVHRLRWAFAEIKRLGGVVPEHYDSLPDRAELRMTTD